ncbi:tRNA pseudouridine(38-40) synthase TruA [bacterium]|nr:tRNA pseudouridine(38-40) synthase TruA [bacterium]
MSHAYALALAYDGTDFAGWQYQPEHRTVQGELEKALERFYGERVPTVGAGRTDAGVHALGQVAGFTVDRRYPTPTLDQALRALLPEDIRLLHTETVGAGFNPRRDALARTYNYFFLSDDSLFFKRYALIVDGALDWDRMAAAARLFEGPRDFAAVGGPVKPGGSTVREIVHCRLENGRNCRRLCVTANAFLNRMVRSIVGCLLAVGRGSLFPDEIVDLLESRDRGRAPAVAPAHGLFLAGVSYAGFSYNPDRGPFHTLFIDG